MKKNGFLTFMCSLVPGVGHMYLGMMRKGLGVMSLFMGIIAVTYLTGLDFLLFALPVIWFYSFFDSMNLRLKSQEERDMLDMTFSQSLGGYLRRDFGGFFAKRHLFAGIVLIFLGFYIFAQQFVYLLPDGIDNVVRSILRDLPTLAIGAIIIVIGIRLCMPQKKSEDLLIYKGGNDNDK